MTTNYSEFRIGSTSDLHLGHKRVSSAFMVENLRKSFRRGPSLALLDVLALCGDVLDHLLQWPQDEISTIEGWMVELMRDCAACNVELWVLEGTPSHDRKQSKRFEILNEMYKIGCKLTYVDRLEIRYFQRFGIHVLFVPDEWSDSSERTLAEVHEHMRALGIQKVDYAIMHGQFEFQLPPVVHAQKHDSEAYLKIVDKLIFIGHVHTFNRKDRIIAQGSHDRISHGEESPKGWVRATVRANDDFDIEFVENKGAAIFRTIELEEVGLSAAIAACRKIAMLQPDGANLRIRANSDNYSLAQLVTEMSSEFENISWTSVAKDAGEKINKLVSELSAKSALPDLITITPDNVTRLLTERIIGLAHASQENVERALKQLKELV